MATVIRGLKSRVLGAVIGTIPIGVGVGALVVFDVPFGNMEPIHYAFLLFVVAMFAVGLFQIGKAALQSEYRVVVNFHRGQLSLRLGKRIFD